MFATKWELCTHHLGKQSNSWLTWPTISTLKISLPTSHHSRVGVPWKKKKSGYILHIFLSRPNWLTSSLCAALQPTTPHAHHSLQLLSICLIYLFGCKSTLASIAVIDVLHSPFVFGIIFQHSLLVLDDQLILLLFPWCVITTATNSKKANCSTQTKKNLPDSIACGCSSIETS